MLSSLRLRNLGCTVLELGRDLCGNFYFQVNLRDYALRDNANVVEVYTDEGILNE
jgi:hypothetical protein